jgi:ABC-type transporter Mla subunit MlaD
MKLTFRLLACPALVVAALLAGPAPAQEKAQADKDINKILETLSEELKQLRTDVNLLTENTKKEVKNLRDEIQELRKSLPAGATNSEEVRKHLERIEQALKALEKLAPTQRTANFPPPAEGRVRLENFYGQAIDVVINGVTYTVRAGTDFVVKLPPGQFTFRIPAIPGYETEKTRTLGTEKPHIITIK